VSSARDPGARLTGTGRIGVKPIRSNALLLAQKKHGKAEINEQSLQHFSDRPKLSGRSSASKRDPSPSKQSDASGSKDKGKKSAKNSEGEEDAEEGSGDEAEKLDEEQLDEIDTIYRK
jgi:DNA repair protein RAD5